MIIRKKTILLISLIVLLVIVGYINHQFTRQSLLRSSNDYQEYEESKLAEINDLTGQTNNDSDVENVNNENNDYDSEIKELTEEIDANIEEVISQEYNNLSSGNYFIEYRLSRDKLRSELIERLNEIINNDKTEGTVRTEAQKEIIRINNTAEKELLIEGLIKAKGFEDALVFLNENSARIVVDCNGELTEQDAMKILEIVTSETKLKPTNIKIMKMTK